jgi:hypothetical protein
VGPTVGLDEVEERNNLHCTASDEGRCCRLRGRFRSHPYALPYLTFMDKIAVRVFHRRFRGSGPPTSTHNKQAKGKMQY